MSGPTLPRDRILSLDVLRGVAVLGILLINVQGFAMLSVASLNPTAFGDLSGANRWVFVTGYLLADQEFLTLFSMLFAAGLLFQLARAEPGRSVASLHYRRSLALLAIGIAHALLLWETDILHAYALCALLLYPLHRWSARSLFRVGLALYAVYSGIALWQGMELLGWSEEQRAFADAHWRGHPLVHASEYAAKRGFWGTQLDYRVGQLLASFRPTSLLWMLTRIGGCMLMGMALFRWGVLTGERSQRFYLRLALAGVGLGLCLRSYGLAADFGAGWSLEYSRYFGYQYKYWGSLLLALGYLGAITWLVRGGHLPGISRVLAAAGRLSLTNYLMQSLICSFIFFGHGLNAFGRVDRIGQLGIVVAIWAFQLAFSWLWTQRFRFGPAELVWRWLSYLRPLSAVGMRDPAAAH